MNTYNQTLPLHCTFHVQEGAIVKTELGHSTTNGLSWEVLFNGRTDKAIEKKIGEWMEAYAERKQPRMELPVSLAEATPFQRSVYQQLIQIPFGEYLTYKELAESVGNDKASRAVGTACGKNPCPLIIPCHRILAAGGRLGGFSCGLPIKRALLVFEEIMPF